MRARILGLLVLMAILIGGGLPLDGSLLGVPADGPSLQSGRPIQAQASAFEAPTYRYSIGVTDPLENFGEIGALAGSWQTNEVFAVDRANHRIFRFGTRGELRWVRGGFGSGEGQFVLPTAIGADGADRLFVVDAGNHRVQIFSAEGEVQGEWGSRGSGEGQFEEAVDIAVTQSGTIYLLDRALGRVQRLRDDGSFIGSFGDGGALEFVDPRGISIAPDGLIWVADTGANTIYRVSSRGTVQGSWDGFGAPIDVAVGHNGDVYVLEQEPARILRFDENMQILDRWGEGEFLAPVSVGLSIGNIVYLADSGRNVIERYHPDGAFEESWGGQWTVEGEFDRPAGLAIGSQGHLYLADSFQNRAHRYDQNGGWLGSFGSEGDAEGRFRGMAGVAASTDTTVYFADPGNNRVQRFGATGSSPSAFGGAGSGDGQFSRPAGLAVAPTGAEGAPEIFVADSGNNRVQRFDRAGAFISAWSRTGSDTGGFDNPTDVFVAPDASLWVSDSGNDRLQAFDLSGGFLREAGASGAEPGQLKQPGGLALDDLGRLWVADRGNGRVQAFDAETGDALGLFGAPGAGAPGMVAPADLALSEDGRIFVADPLAHRILVYGPPAGTGWHVAFYDNPALAGHPARAEDLARLTFRWADGRPAPGLPADGFALRAEGYLDAPRDGQHQLTVRAEGGLRLWLAGRLRIDAWDEASVDESLTISLPAGEHFAMLEYQDPGGLASLDLSWSPTGGGGTVSTPTPGTVPTPGGTAARIFLPFGLRGHAMP